MARAVAVGLVVVLAATGCASMPTDGPVVETRSKGDVADAQGPYIDPLPPQAGDTRADVVRGFLNAMTATPIQANTAREFLTADAAASWTPDDETLTYADSFRVEESAQGVTVTLSEPDRLDAQGAWLGAAPRGQRRVEFPMAFEKGEWRIDRAPNALIVPESWFADRYRQVSLYYFDPTATMLAPEPVFVPKGKQLASALTQALLLGPGDALDRVAQSFLPPGLKVNLSVPISDQGIADIGLKGDAGDLTPQSIELMLAQLAWTLRQDRSIEALRVSINGEPLPLPGSVSAYRVDGGAEYDPAGFQSSPLVYGLRNGVLASGTGPSIEPVSGPFGSTKTALRSVAVSLTAATAAAVTADGGTALTGPVSGADQGRVRTVLSGGRDLMRPAWDFADRLWLVDRTTDGAVVSWWRQGRLHALDVPGISGRRVRSFLVSRDGTRFVAVVRRAAGDVVLVSRIAHDHSGRVLWASRARAIAGEPGSDLPVRAISWSTPTTLAVLSPFPATTSVVQLSSASVDGSPMVDGSPRTLGGGLRALVGSPVPGEPLYGVSADGVVNLATNDRRGVALPEGTSALTYVG